MQLISIDISAVNHLLCTVYCDLFFYLSWLILLFSEYRFLFLSQISQRRCLGFKVEEKLAVFQAFLWCLLVNWRGSCWVMQELLFSLYFVLCADSTATRLIFILFFWLHCCTFSCCLLPTPITMQVFWLVYFFSFNHLSFICCPVAVLHNKE